MKPLSYIVLGFLLGLVGSAFAAFNDMPISRSAVTVSSCGGGSPSVSGNSIRGTISLGSASPVACTLNFTTVFASAPTCIGTAGSAAANIRTSAISTSAATFMLSATMATMYYHCIQ
jgi:hypothetical protein